MTKAAGFAKDFREHHYLGRAEVPVPRAWYNALLPGLTNLLDTMSSLPCGVAETLQCIELFVQAYWQALPIRMLKYGQAELDSMEKLGLKVPYLSEWAEKQAASKRLAEGWASDAEPATKQQRVELPQETAEPGSALAAKRKGYAAHVESLECARLDMVAQERASLAIEQAEAKAAIAADDRAVQPTHTVTATATTDIPCMLNLQSTSAMSTLPAAEAMRNHHTYANLPAQQRQALDTGGRRLFRGDSVAAIWKEWQYGGEYASVKSLLHESKSSGKMTWRGSGKGTIKQSERSELCKKQHLPQAIHVLIKQGLPEQEAVRQVDELLLKFGITNIRTKFDAFLWRHQMKSPKKGLKPAKKGTQKLSTKNPDATVKTFHEAYERLLQAATINTVAKC